LISLNPGASSSKLSVRQWQALLEIKVLVTVDG